MGHSQITHTPRIEERYLISESIRRKRMDTADKIVMVLVDRIVMDLIRPGPKPEERECYEMALELREMIPSLQTLVESILAVDRP